MRSCLLLKKNLCIKPSILNYRKRQFAPFCGKALFNVAYVLKESRD